MAALHARRKEGISIRTLMRDFRISKATVYRYLGTDGPDHAAPTDASP
jgi:DNA-binding IclR family transcriptional regulator